MDPLVGDYHFGASERRAYNALRGGNDEKWAYLVFARAKRHAEDQRMVGHPRRTHKYRKDPFRLMKEWRALDELERHDRVRRARNDPNRPDAVDIQVEFEDPDSPGSIEDFSDVNAGGLTYRFVKTLYKWHNRAVGAPDDVMGSDDRQRCVVRLYSGMDDRGRVRDRVVVKVADWEMPPDTLDADDQDSYDPYAEDRKFVEDEVDSLLRKYRRVNGLRQCDHILKPRHWVESDYTYTARDANGNVRFRADGPEMSIRRLGVRSYSDYCELGNLTDIILDYSWENANIEPDDWSKIPEAFICHVFYAVSIALYVLYTGEKYDKDVQLVAEGRQNGAKGPPGVMIHRDIKPENIFLKAPIDPNDYPIPVLADFDSATSTTKVNDRRGGTNGYIAPEHYDTDPEASPITTKTDIWSLAAVIWDMMNSKRGFASDRWEAGLNRMRNELHTAMTMAPNTFGGGEQVDDRFPTHDYMAQKHPRDDLPPYTTWLKHLVNECTRYVIPRHKAEHRLDAIDLVEELENHLHDMFLVKDARFLPHDTLRRRNDPFLPDRIWNVDRRRRGQNN